MKKLILTIALSLACVLSGMGQNIVYGPWVTATDESSFTVLWVTDTPGLACVELEDGSRFWHEFAGRRIFERLHSVKVVGLEKGRDYNYKLVFSAVKDDTDARDPEFFPEQVSGPYTTGTFDKSSASCRFSVVNDMHLETDKYRDLISHVDSLTTDFIFLNGDIASAGNYCLDTLAHYDIEPLKGYSQRVPVFFARGNHEGRGNNPKLVSEIFPTSTGKFYYTFRQGPVAFLVLDAGETGTSRSVDYTGTPIYEKYLNEQKEWAVEAMKDPAFAKAPIKICMLHVPMVHIGRQGAYNVHRWMNENIVPILNKAGFNLMISGDLHVFRFDEAGTMGNKFPILVNDTECRVDVECSKSGYSLTVTDKNGQVKLSHSEYKGKKRK